MRETGATLCSPWVATTHGWTSRSGADPPTKPNRKAACAVGSSLYALHGARPGLPPSPQGTEYVTNTSVEDPAG